MRTFYEVEQAIGKKADQWELQNVKNENDRLKNQINDLERKIQNSENNLLTANQKMDVLLDFLIENGKFENDNQLHNIKSQY